MWTPSNTWMLEPTPLTTPNGIQIQSAVFSQFTHKAQTHRPPGGIVTKPVPIPACAFLYYSDAANNVKVNITLYTYPVIRYNLVLLHFSVSSYNCILFVYQSNIAFIRNKLIWFDLTNKLEIRSMERGICPIATLGLHLTLYSLTGSRDP